MFSSLASFIFGSNTNCETNQNPTRQQQQEQQQQQKDQQRDDGNAENTIEVTSSTPSVTGTRSHNVTAQAKRGKNKRTTNNRNKRQGVGVAAEVKPTPSLSKLLTPNDSFEDDFDEDDWFIVERENEEDSLPRTDSEEDLSIVELKPKYAAASSTAAPRSPINNRRRGNCNFHSLYGGPRPQQQRNLLQRARNAGARNGAGLSRSTLSPPRCIVDAIGAGANPLADVGMTQSLYVAPHNCADGSSGSGNEFGAHISMEESWFVTPPPCFTSIGPINMETSPFENLLIEHPSMSVYHSIRSAQEATESFVNLDLGVVESQNQQKPRRDVVPSANIKSKVNRKTQVVPQRSTGVNTELYSAAQVKKALFAYNTQKCHDIIDRQSMCRGAIKRANKVRDFQSKGNRQRRADMQHCKVVSGVNNNRKCCF